MSDVKITLKQDKGFNPINVILEFTIETKVEMDGWVKEQQEGLLSDITTEYSNKLYDVLKALAEDV